ncbi:Hypothetical protein NTJ_02138 [Nesidiocoris tenuis]|uniref:Uncharacterized protein n=1 Tax=Nesidiocoris tenuis TaxID=355587 RepID=A0ABN7AAI9_9HEMI|nr:Hypothetical protein NTJ_02138 [Nesidiocoris tenuis]
MLPLGDESPAQLENSRRTRIEKRVRLPTNGVPESIALAALGLPPFFESARPRDWRSIQTFKRAAVTYKIPNYIFFERESDSNR